LAEIEAKRNAEIAQAWKNLNKKEISEEETYKNVVLTVEAPEKSLPVGTEIRIEPITDKEEIKTLKDQLVKETTVKTDSELLFFDISFIYKVSDGAEIKLQSKKSEKVKVSFNYTNNSTLSEVSNELKVYYLDEEDDKNNKDEKIYNI